MSERDNLPDKLFECAAEVVVVEEGRALVHIQQGSKVCYCGGEVCKDKDLRVGDKVMINARLIPQGADIEEIPYSCRGLWAENQRVPAHLFPKMLEPFNQQELAEYRIFAVSMKGKIPTELDKLMDKHDYQGLGSLLAMQGIIEPAPLSKKPNDKPSRSSSASSESEEAEKERKKKKKKKEKKKKKKRKHSSDSSVEEDEREEKDHKEKKEKKRKKDKKKKKKRKHSSESSEEEEEKVAPKKKRKVDDANIPHHLVLHKLNDMISELERNVKPGLPADGQPEEEKQVEAISYPTPGVAYDPKEVNTWSNMRGYKNPTLQSNWLGLSVAPGAMINNPPPPPPQPLESSEFIDLEHQSDSPKSGEDSPNKASLFQDIFGERPPSPDQTEGDVPKQAFFRRAEEVQETNVQKSATKSNNLSRALQSRLNQRKSSQDDRKPQAAKTRSNSRERGYKRRKDSRSRSRDKTGRDNRSKSRDKTGRDNRSKSRGKSSREVGGKGRDYRSNSRERSSSRYKQSAQQNRSARDHRSGSRDQRSASRDKQSYSRDKQSYSADKRSISRRNSRDDRYERSDSKYKSELIDIVEADEVMSERSRSKSRKKSKKKDKKHKKRKHKSPKIKEEEEEEEDVEEEDETQGRKYRKAESKRVVKVSYSDEEAGGSNASASSSPFKPLPESDEDEKKMIEKIRKKRAKLIAKIPSLPESVEIKTEVFEKVSSKDNRVPITCFTQDPGGLTEVKTYKTVVLCGSVINDGQYTQLFKLSAAVLGQSQRYFQCSFPELLKQSNSLSPGSRSELMDTLDLKASKFDVSKEGMMNVYHKDENLGSVKAVPEMDLLLAFLNFLQNLDEPVVLFLHYKDSLLPTLLAKLTKYKLFDHFSDMVLYCCDLVGLAWSLHMDHLWTGKHYPSLGTIAESINIISKQESSLKTESASTLLVGVLNQVMSSNQLQIQKVLDMSNKMNLVEYMSVKYTMIQGVRVDEGPGLPAFLEMSHSHDAWGVRSRVDLVWSSMEGLTKMLRGGSRVAEKRSSPLPTPPAVHEGEDQVRIIKPEDTSLDKMSNLKFRARQLLAVNNETTWSSKSYNAFLSPGVTVIPGNSSSTIDLRVPALQLRVNQLEQSLALVQGSSDFNLCDIEGGVTTIRSGSSLFPFVAVTFRNPSFHEVKLSSETITYPIATLKLEQT